MKKQTSDGSLRSTITAAPPKASTVSPSLLDDFLELNITQEDDENLTSLLNEAGWDEAGKDKQHRSSDVALLPIEWVVDIADKDDDWFLATAYGYNDVKQTLHVNVPDRNEPTWTGDVALNPLAVRLLECCDNRSMALFKQLVRESAIEVDWDVSIGWASGRSKHAGICVGDSADATTAIDAGNDNTASSPSPADDSKRSSGHQAVGGEDGADTSTTAATTTGTASAAPGAAARATLLLPLGNLIVVQKEPGEGRSGRSDEAVSGTFSKRNDGTAARGGGGGGKQMETPPRATEETEKQLVRLDDRVELLQCRGMGDPGEEAFYRVAEEGLVLYDPAKVNWRAYKRRAKMRRQDDRRRGSLAESSSSAIEALTAAPVKGCTGNDSESGVSLLKGVGSEIRSLARRALDLRDDLLTEHLATLRRVRRLVLDGSLEDGAALMEQVDEAHVGVLDERHMRDKERITTDAAALEILLLTVAGAQGTPAQGTPATTAERTLQTTPPPEIATTIDGKHSEQEAGKHAERQRGLPPAPGVTVSRLMAGGEADAPAAMVPGAGSGS